MKDLRADIHIQKHLFDLLFLIRSRMKDVVQDADAELSPMQIIILRKLVEEGEMTQAMLVQKLGRDKSQVTRLVHDLEKKKLLVKEHMEEDRRSFKLKPAKEVQKKVLHFMRHEQKIVSEMLSGITKEDSQKLIRLLLLMNKNLKK